jgi:hypothetical protein
MEIGASLSPNSESAHWPQHCVVVSVKPTSTTLGNGGVPGVRIQTCLGQAGRANWLFELERASWSGALI